MGSSRQRHLHTQPVRHPQGFGAFCRLPALLCGDRQADNGPVTACTEPVAEGMVVNTQGLRAKRLARTALELLLASHPVDCAHCAKNRSCELQKLCSLLGVKLKTKRFRKLEHQFPVDSSCPDFHLRPQQMRSLRQVRVGMPGALRHRGPGFRPSRLR